MPGHGAIPNVAPLAGQPAALPTVRPFAPLNPAAAHGISPTGFPAAAGNFAGAPLGAMRAGMPAALSTSTSAAQAPDPIAEAPAAIWYVRPASGGQFGPAAGDVMRQWLTQKRVGPDSLLWREGWTDWKKAVVVFPSLGPSPAVAAATQAAAPTSNFAADDDWVEAIIDTKPSIGHHAPAHAHRSKGKQSNTIVIVSFFLILLCVLLAVVLVTVFMQQSKESNDSSGLLRPSHAAICSTAVPGNNYFSRPASLSS
jgi:hypothetical protein